MCFTFTTQLTILCHHSCITFLFLLILHVLLLKALKQRAVAHSPQVCSRPSEGKAHSVSAKGKNRLILTRESVCMSALCQIIGANFRLGGAINCNHGCWVWQPQHPQKSKGQSPAWAGWMWPGVWPQDEAANRNVLGKGIAVHLEHSFPTLAGTGAVELFSRRPST